MNSETTDASNGQGRWSAPCLLEPDVVKARLEDLGVTQKQLAKTLGIQTRTVSFWLARDPKRRPDLAQVQRLASRIGLEPGDIATVDFERADEVAQAGGLPLSGRFFEQFLGPQARKLWPSVIYYLRAIELQMSKLPGHIEKFVHDGTRPRTYAQITVRPSQQSAVQTFNCYFHLGNVLRVRFGSIALASTGELSLAATWTNDQCEDRLADDGSFTWYTWFGEEACTFAMQSEHPFQLVDVKTAEGYDMKHPQGLCFAAGPHHDSRPSP